jgi:hypothetical protein
MLKKICFLIAGLLLLNFNAQKVYSQNWATTTITGTSNINSIAFTNPNTGYAFYPHKVYKTTNKGVNWSQIADFGSGFNAQSTMAFPPQGKIFIHAGLRIYYSTNEGSSWEYYHIHVNGQPVTVTAELPVIKFKDANTGFFTFSTMNSSYAGNSRIYRTTNGGDSWNEVANFTTGTSTIVVIQDFGFSKNNPNNMNLVGYQATPTSSIKTYFTANSTDGGASWVNAAPGPFYQSRAVTYESIEYVNHSTESYRVISVDNYPGNSATGTYCIKSENGTVTQSKITSTSNNSQIGGLKFINYNTGFVRISNEFYLTTNSGDNWSQISGLNLNSVSAVNNVLSSYGDVVYTTGDGDLYTKTIPTSLITTFDGTSGSGALAFDGSNYGTPSSQELRGGYSEIYANPILQNSSLSNTDAIFYKWSNGYMPNVRANEEYLYPGSFTADYKTKKYSTTSNSISNVTQRRAFRDINGNVNTVHESMGGIFFTKSTNNGATFIKEEIVSDRSGVDQWATNNNANSFINEVYRPTVMTTPYSTEKTPVVIWEQRSGNTITINTANRWKSSNGQYYWWEKDWDATFNFNSDDVNFKSYPKVFSQIRNFLPNGGDTTYQYLYLIPYLKPSSTGGTKLVVKVIDQSLNVDREEEIVSGSVSDVSVDAIYSHPYSTPVNIALHITYKKDNKIYYRKEIFEYESLTTDILWTTDPSPFEVSSADGLGSRYTPDISLSNGNPVIAYRGSKTTLKTVVWYDSGPSEPVIDEINIAKNPIYIRKKSSSGQWGNFEIYNSNGSETQLNPDVEGSKDADAHLIGFSVGNPSTGATFKKFVKIAGQNGYNCDPGIFNGNDAMFVKGSYTGTTGSTSYPMLWTSKSENSLYKIDKQSFVISNMISTPDSYNNLAGVVGMEGLDYTFTLGPIFAASTIPALDPKDAPTHISSFVEFNENMVSAPFVMSDLDTLILGAAGSYTPSSESAFSNTIRYDVNLLYASTGNLHRVLFTDTVHAGDSLEPEFLRGFIIDNIPNGSDSFYVQLALYEDDLNDGDYTLNGVYMGGEGDGDNSGYKTMVFFEGDNPLVGNQSFIPKEYALNQNYPNPFNPSTTISYDIPTDGLVKMKIYDLAGREVKTLVNEIKTAGRYTVSFNGSSLSSGVYFYRIESGNFVQTKKMLLVK